MTKYILIGGYPYKAADDGKAMCLEAINGFSEPVNVLICPFARKPERWEKAFKETKILFTKNLPDTKFNFIQANETDFINQIKKTNILFFKGGETADLINRLNKIPDWLKFLDHKTVIGTSAGTDMLSTYNYDIEFFRLDHGFGLVPVKTIVHYQSAEYTPPIGWAAALEELKKYRNDLPVWALRVGEYKTIKI